MIPFLLVVYFLIAGFACSNWVIRHERAPTAEDIRWAFVLGWLFWPLHGLSEVAAWYASKRHW